MPELGLEFYGIAGALILAAAAAAYRFFFKEDVLVIAAGDKEREAAEALKGDAHDSKAILNTVASNVAKAELEHDAAIANIKRAVNSKKAEVTKADTTKLKDYLTQEGYNVTEIFPED